MAKSDDLDLIRLFGLSREEASGLGLTADGRAADADAAAGSAGPSAPAGAEAPEGHVRPGQVSASATRAEAGSHELPAHLEPVASGLTGPPVSAETAGPAQGLTGPPVSADLPTRWGPRVPAQRPSTDATHGPEAVTPPAVPSGPRTASRADELALLAMLDGAETTAEAETTTIEYNGHGATRGLSLADNVPQGPSTAGRPAPHPQPTAETLSPRPRDEAAGRLPTDEAEQGAGSDVERFVIPNHAAADEDDDLNLVSLFGLSPEEAVSLGLPVSPQAHATQGDSPVDAKPTPPSDGTSFPTMQLRAIDEHEDDGPSAAQPGGLPMEHGNLPATERAAEHMDVPVRGRASEADGQSNAASEPGPAAITRPEPRNQGVAASVPEMSVATAADVSPPAPATSAEQHAVDEPDSATCPPPPAASPVAVSPDGAGVGVGADQQHAQPSWGSSPTRPAGNIDPAHVAGDINPAHVAGDIDPALLDAFAEESTELLDGLHVELEHLEGDAEDHGALLEARRIIHTVKGGAKMCAFEDVAALTHACENLLDLIADGAAPLDTAALRALFDTEPLLRASVQDAISGRGTDVAAVAGLVARFDALCAAAAETATNKEAAAPAPAAGAPADAAADSADTPDWEMADRTALAPAESLAAEETAAALAEPTHPTAAIQAPDLTRDREAVASTGASIDSGPLPPEPRVTARDVRRGSNSINVDLSKVDAVAAKVTEMAAQRVSSQNMVTRLVETAAEARRNVVRLHNLVTQIGNECAGMQPEVTVHDDLDLVSYNALNTLVLQLQEAVSDQQALVQAIHDAITNHWSLQAAETRLDADIQNTLMSIRLVPIATMRVRLDGVVRQAAEATGKLVRWQLQGGSVAVEKNVFDRLFEPLMHLLRNAVDHGIETPVARREAGKSESGAITVSAAQEGNHIVITVSDDGGGIVPNKIAALAVERGLISSEQANGMSYQEKLGLIFTPGFSTADRISHISGRGVGMDAVREACLRMGGSIDVSSRPGMGSTFTMRLPLSLSAARALIVRDGGCVMALPVDQVTALHLVAASDVVETPAGRVARLEGQELPIYNLPPLPGARPASYVQNGEVNVLQVAHANGSIGLLIEDVLGEEEISIKAPPALLRGVKTLLGAYVLPDGRVAPVINLPQLLIDLRPVAMLAPPPQEDRSGELIALVVDDSMSMRVALSGTLQSAGFTVLTARDGQEALDVLKREGLPNLVTLDVEMPRMDGLETLFAIRQLPNAEELPVFMLTSRGGAKHRRAAEQLGATRYFTKPYRDSELATAAREACASAITA